MSRTIAIVAGYWSTNIGNSFFQLGALYSLQHAFPQADVGLVADQPGYWGVTKGNPANALDMLSWMSPDCLVILGPYLRPEFPRIWGRSLDALRRKNVKLVVLGAGMMDYSKRAFAQAKAWLAHCPPDVFVTRDHPTYQELGHLARHAYDGVDMAAFVSDLHPPRPNALPPYVVFNFDQRPEPIVKPVNLDYTGPGAVRFDGQTWRFAFPRVEDLLAKRSKAWPYARALLPSARKYPEYLGNKLIVRTDHRFNPMVLRKAYAGPNSFASDVPYTYLDLYGNAEATFSNRVHACVATLSYGRPALLFSTSPRAYLLDRLGATRIRSELTAIDTQQLAEEKDRMLRFLRRALA